MNKHMAILMKLKQRIEVALEKYNYEYKSSNKIKVYIHGKLEGNWEKHYVYIIMNLLNCKLYIGQTRNIKLRLEQHMLAQDFKTSPFHKEIKKIGIKHFKTIFLIEIRSKLEPESIQLGITLEKFLQIQMESNLPGKGYNVNHPETSVEKYLYDRNVKRELLEYYRELYPVEMPIRDNNIDEILLMKRLKYLQYKKYKKIILQERSLLGQF